jgi:hypothetical protein
MTKSNPGNFFEDLAPGQQIAQATPRAFKETVQARAKKERAFRAALVSEGVQVLLQGDLETGRSLLRDYINGTILALEVRASASRAISQRG